MKTSDNEFDGVGAVVNGFDYRLQVWVKDGIVQACGHPPEMGASCCNGRRFAGMRVTGIAGHQIEQVEL